jgi:hypothetical protein
MTVEVPYCWVVTRAVDGGVNARAVRAFSGEPDDDEWTRRFLTLREARKAAEIRVAPQVTLAFQHASGEACVALARAGGTDSRQGDDTQPMAGERGVGIPGRFCRLEDDCRQSWSRADRNPCARGDGGALRAWSHAVAARRPEWLASRH